jgi:hypothetical protein
MVEKLNADCTKIPVHITGASSYLYDMGTTGLEVLTAVAVKSSIFWDIMPCSAVDFHHITWHYIPEY